MEKELLRKVQLAQLEVAKEIKRVCDENDIQYFLAFGTLIGAVRHQGFIPWDDDMDMGMVRSEYEKFCRIAPEKLKPEFFLQTWYSDPNYPLPFAKVRKRNTVYLEGKSMQLKENGFFVDIFPFDFLPEKQEDQEKILNNMNDLLRVKLMKSGFKPWMENGKVIWKKRIGYLYFQAKALFSGGEALARKYDELVMSFPENGKMYWQETAKRLYPYNREWCEDLMELPFEDVSFKCPRAYHEALTAYYGDYMQLPPEEERENRHQIEVVDFGE